jgi:CRISPR/Cas system CSM-associated protein Csm3 (group 7 of RAMP superfamily)
MNKRYIASILVEADTPLKISSGSTSLLTDSEVFRDVNGLPMILGTSLAGVLRHSLELDDPVDKDIFGYQDKKGGKGSRIILSHAHMVGDNGGAIEGLAEVDLNSEFYRHYASLPIRDHAKISHTGAVDIDERGKFDEEVVYKGTRFRFEIELVGTDNDRVHWDQILNQLKAPDFRIGGGTRKGFGKLKIVEIVNKDFDLTTDLDEYLNKSSSLNMIDGFNKYTEESNEIANSEKWITYILKLTPENLWMFGSGLSDDQVDMTPVFERIVTWDNLKPSFTEEIILIPASSVKGAISHRVAYHYNKLNEVLADQMEPEDLKNHVGSNNPAVKELFGYTVEKTKLAQRGKVLFSDVFIQGEPKTKTLSHVSIDRFTGGAMPGALFDEKVIDQQTAWEMVINVDKKAMEMDDKVKEAFEKTLEDICSGMLPLGGGVMRGHGCFTGKWEKKNDK